MEYKYNYVIFNSPDNKLRVDNDGYYTIRADKSRFVSVG